MENIEIKVTIKEETKKTKVYDFSESIKALEKAQNIAAAVMEEATEAIYNSGMQSFENWVARLHKELNPVLNNHGVMCLIDQNIYFGHSRFETIARVPEKDEFVLTIYHSGGKNPCMLVKFLPNRYDIHYGSMFEPTTDLKTFSDNVEFVHKTIMDKITYAIRNAKKVAQQRAEERVTTLENLLNM